MTRTLAVALAAAMLATLHAAPARRAKKKHRPDPLRVMPSENIEARVAREIALAESIISELEPDRILDSPYLVSAVYYRDGFLHSYPSQKADGDPSRRIIGHLARLLTPDLKARYIRMLREFCDLNAPHETEGPRFVAPVRFETPRRGRMRRTHKHAIDLFAAEGSTVRSASPGVVVLAEGAWDPADPLSSSSREGGNTVIVFDCGAGRFYRYCHLDSVAVEAGGAVNAGQAIGKVGHTGLNASRKGHGRHLHFEVNRFDGQNMVPATYQEIRALLKNAPVAAPPAVTRIPTAETRAGALP